MATLGKNNDSNFIPPGNTIKSGIISPKSKIIAKKIGDIPTDSPNRNAADPSHN